MVLLPLYIVGEMIVMSGNLHYLQTEPAQHHYLKCYESVYL